MVAMRTGYPSKAKRRRNKTRDDHMLETIVLVDKNDKPVGFEEKIKAHEDGGHLHRAFSVVVFNPEGESLLQLRSVKKHHFGGLWTNTVCSHPRKGESLSTAAHRRLKEEFGFDTPLKERYSFIYKAKDPASGLTEWEFDHVFTGTYNGTPHPDRKEIDNWKWVNGEDILREIRASPGQYTYWSRLIFKKLFNGHHDAKPNGHNHNGHSKKAPASKRLS
jgi:isopentenyl-diphosphate delta-isomerase